MAGPFDFLSNIAKGTASGVSGVFNTPGALGDLYKNDPDALSILLGNLGSIFGQGSPGLEAAGKFGAGLGYTGKLDTQQKGRDDFWKQLLGGMTGPKSPGLTGVKMGDDGKFTIDATAPSELSGDMTLDNDTTGIDTGGFPISTQDGAASGTSGGGAATAPFPLSPPSASSNSSDIISALAGAYSGESPSLRWLTPEMAMNVMGQNIQNRQLANRFVAEQTRQNMRREELAARYGGKVASDEVRVSFDENDIPFKDPKGTHVMKTSALATAGAGRLTREGTEAERTRTAKETEVARVEGLEDTISDEVGKALGASDWFGLRGKDPEILRDAKEDAITTWDKGKSGISLVQSVNQSVRRAENIANILSVEEITPKAGLFKGAETPAEVAKRFAEERKADKVSTETTNYMRKLRSTLVEAKAEGAKDSRLIRFLVDDGKFSPRDARVMVRGL